MKIIDLKDRFARILIAGTFASFILFALNLFSYYILHFSNRRFINYSALMIFGREFNSFTEAIISSITQIGFSTSLIVIFSHLILKEKSENYILIGLFIGFGSWFGIMSLCYIIGIHKILAINIGSATSFMVTSIIWGILGAWFLHMLDERYV
ncbi:hypothetical protein UF75_5151 [Desulfosporosinus sp. I2]|uniref:hypothetical protein n=1 Tax=Desulfosporosinus sp. I2 TaxID=1617025 RepID=UPI0005ED94F3|nr:hypothetical protein [Desulfosporosinus sp. I2]KJR44468.1 hypothetical protein UF75_5151 [Desulfosporosinus sp. I2]